MRFSVPEVIESGAFFVVLGAAMAVSTYPQPLNGPLCGERCSIALPSGGGSPQWTWYFWSGVAALGFYIVVVGVLGAIVLGTRRRRRSPRKGP